ncbi:MAG: hypothetical protein EBU82_14955 [Flavobacteriia bacterium]|jgi:hypothetical protein|nr:hypothetical protein [Flavobacteriia bacterium]NBP30644.1 hypothetical protein [Flavobacteriia bacterium]
MPIKILTLLGFLFLFNAIDAQTTLNKVDFPVEILFTQDSLDVNSYELTCITDSPDLFGTINIYNSKGKILLQLKDIEIPHAPGFHGIDVSEFPKGDIKIEVFVDDIPHVKNFRI